MSKSSSHALVAISMLLIVVTGVVEWTAEDLRPYSDVAQWIILASLLLAAREAMKRLNSSESKLRALVGSLDELILVLDKDGRYIDAASTNATLLFQPADRIIGRRIHDVFPKESADRFVAEIRRALAADHAISVDYVLHIEGREVWFNASVTRISSSTVIWVARDITARKNAEIELENRVADRTVDLQRSEARYRTLVEQAGEIIFTLSKEGIITSLNPAFERILGWKAEQWIGKPFAGLVPAEVGRECARLFDALQENGKLDLVRITALHENGTRVSLELTARQKFDHGGAPSFLGVARDVTQRDDDEAQIRKSERQLAEAQTLANVGSFDHNLSTGMVMWSEHLYRMLGREPAADPISEALFAEMIVEEDRHMIAEVQRFIATQGEHEWEMRLRAADGSLRTTRCRGKLVIDKSTATMRVVGAVRDITEERRAGEMLRRSEERFRLATLATSDAIWDGDLLSGGLWLSEAWRRFGYEPGTVENGYAWYRERIHPTDYERVVAAQQEAMGSGQSSWSVEYKFRRADGSYAHVLDRAYIVRDDAKQPVRIIGATMDLTEREQLLDQLEQAKRVSSLGRVAASIAHEFNNVLMGIQPNVEVIQRSSPSGLRMVTDNIVRAVQRGKRVTDEILRFTRPIEPSLQSIHVPEFFERWRAENAPQLSLVDLVIDVAREPFHVSADAMQLSQVFTNLALNARDAMQDRPGRLTISAHISNSYGTFAFGVVKSPDRFVHFTVADEGCGISSDRLAHIFEPLFTTKRGGIGLGLAVTYQIVTRHQGHIFVESEVGRGSTFHVFLPAALPAIGESPLPAETNLSGIRRLLLVEDEPAVAAGIAMLLEMDGIEMTIVHTGGESIPAIEAKQPDAVILDIGLPDMDGVGVYLEIERRWPGLPVLFSSGHGDSAKLEQYLARPNVGFILKPYDFDTMRAELAKLVEAKQATIAC